MTKRLISATLRTRERRSSHDIYRNIHIIFSKPLFSRTERRRLRGRAPTWSRPGGREEEVGAREKRKLQQQPPPARGAAAAGGRGGGGGFQSKGRRGVWGWSGGAPAGPTGFVGRVWAAAPSAGPGGDGVSP